MEKNLIKSIDIFKLDLDFVKPFRISLGEITKSRNLIIKINTNSGLTGLGEASLLWSITGETQDIAIAAARECGKILVGKDPYAIETRMKELNSHLVYNSSIKSAFDMALYDLLAKQAGLPLYSLLGGEKKEIMTNMTIGIDDPDVMADDAVKYKEAGAFAIKVKLGTNTQDDVARIKAIREKIGFDILLRIDANQGWDPVTAVTTLHELTPFCIEYCEEPIAHWNNDALRRVREKSLIPIMADESIFDCHDAFKLAKMGACDYFNIKLAKSGGIYNALKINAVAEAAGIFCMIGGMQETRVAISAGAHLISSCSNIKFADLDSINHHIEDPVVGGVVFSGSKVTLSEAPGHGADIRPEFLEHVERIK